MKLDKNLIRSHNSSNLSRAAIYHEQQSITTSGVWKMIKEIQETAEVDPLKLLRKSQKENLKLFFDFLRFPSISALPEHKEDTIACAHWLKKQYEELGFEVNVFGDGPPVLLAVSPNKDPTLPTLMLYHHYDVQPVDPVEEWTSDPFEPREEEGVIYARGAQDNKGQCFYTLMGLKLYRELYGDLPQNLKVIIEGEEEIGSASLSKTLKNYDFRRRLFADALAVVDSGIPSKDVPALTLGLRGIVTIDLVVKGPETDLHSGAYGGAALNPIHVLVKLLSDLHHADGSVAVPSFYDQVLPVADSIKKELLANLPESINFGDGVPLNGGERNLHPLIRVGLRPALEVNGISGGYQGDGFKTVIPHTAKAKLSCRLVPDQDPKWVGDLVCDYLESQAPEGAKVSAKVRPGMGPALRADPNSLVAQAFEQAYRDIFEKPCVHLYSGGSVPITAELSSAADCEVLCVGLGLESDNIHAPDEHFDVARLEQGALLICGAIKKFLSQK